MATVLLAEDLKHHRRVAIKALDPEVAAAIGPERFLREIAPVAGLAHPHACGGWRTPKVTSRRPSRHGTAPIRRCAACSIKPAPQCAAPVAWRGPSGVAGDLIRA